MKTPSRSMHDLYQDSYLTSGSDAYIEALYETYLTDKDAVSSEWQAYFSQLMAQLSQSEIPHLPIREALLHLAAHKQRQSIASSQEHVNPKQEAVLDLINAYRRLGHLQADIDPLGLRKPELVSSLDWAYYQLSEQDANTVFSTGSYTGLNRPQATLKEITDSLRHVYCGSIGFEYRHINRVEEIDWLRSKIEDEWNHFNPSDTEKRHLLNRLVVADGFEKYLGFKYVGQKRFSLEGGDSLIPLLDTIVRRSAEHGVKEAIIGMPHRGRLTVLANVVGKSPKEIFSAFEGAGISKTHSGDVKYHLGCSSSVKTPYGSIHLVLAFNPSHLEIVSPVVQGSVRARQRRRKDTAQRTVLPIQLHGDAAFAGQGVVMETFNMSQTRWFKVGGSIHIVVNNQLGFTISNPQDARSTTYCTDIAKMVEAPILHVNANNPEAVYFAALLAIDYRLRFARDIVIDLVCYRRHGHNEADEPSATQPLMYKKIRSLPVPYQMYAQKLIEEGVIKAGFETQMAEDYRRALDEGKPVVDLDYDHYADEFAVSWNEFLDKDWTESVSTSISRERLTRLAARLASLPEGFVLQPQVKKVLAQQKKMGNGEVAINWGYAEILAYASLLEEGYPIRICGQDVARGTFAHRHVVLHDQNSDELYIPLSHIVDGQAQINIVDSFLSEEAVLAFEYGYATAEPNYLVIWEAQFGDFANGAQVVIDQFISSGEQKWGRLCGLVMLLPHGYEGMGPEHSSARLERYLQLCAQQNMQVCVPTTPAQIFHLLRRQMVRTYRKPLIVMSPKSVLRHPLAVSTLDDLSSGEFQLVIPELDELDKKSIEQVILCSGKVYYDLLQKRRDAKLSKTAILRIEQLYPFPEKKFKEVFSAYQHVKDIVWCQEEPENQGAWDMIKAYLLAELNTQQVLRYAGRKASASPAVGYHATHEEEQQALVTQAFNL